MPAYVKVNMASSAGCEQMENQKKKINKGNELLFAWKHF